MFIVWFHVQCDALTLAATLKASRQIKNADSVNQRIINVPNLIPIRLEMTQPYLDFFLKTVTPIRRRRMKNNMSTDIRSVPDLKTR